MGTMSKPTRVGLRVQAVARTPVVEAAGPLRLAGVEQAVGIPRTPLLEEQGQQRWLIAGLGAVVGPLVPLRAVHQVRVGQVFA